MAAEPESDVWLPYPATEVGSSAVSQPAFVGRERELALVTAALTNPPALILIEGEAGIGKSRLVQESLAAASLRDLQVLSVNCPPLREPFPLGPVVDGLRRLRDSIQDVPLSPLAGALRPLFPEWSADLPPGVEPLEDAGATRHRLLRALAELVDRLGVDLLVIEDAHWADAATLEWLLMLTAAGRERMSVIVTYRSGDVPARSLLLRLTSHRPVGRALLRVSLQPLDTTQTGRLVASMFTTVEVSERFTEFLYQHTDGLPLAVEESVLLLRDRRDLVRRSGIWARRVVEELRVPPTLRDVVRERVVRLDSTARAILRAAAVLAEPADETLLFEVAGLDEQECRRGLAAALASGLIMEVGNRIAFRHALHARAVEEEIPVSDRRQMDRRAAEMLRQWPHPPVVRLSRHCRRAGDLAGWARYTEAAAGLALGAGDHYTAVVMLHELLIGADHPPRLRARLARTLGEATCSRPAQLAGLETVLRDTLRSVVVAGSDLPRTERGEIRLLLGWLLFQLADFDAGQAQLEIAVEELGDQPVRAARAMIMLSYPLAANQRPIESHLAWLLRVADVLADTDMSAHDRLTLTCERTAALLLLGEESGWPPAAELPAYATTAPDRYCLALAHSNIGTAAMLWGRYAEARRRLVMASELTEGDRLQYAITASHAHIDWMTGAWEDLVTKAIELSDSEDAPPAPRQEGMLVAGLLAAACGDGRNAELWLRQVLDRATQRADFLFSLEPSAALGRLYLAQGQVRDALAITDEPMRLAAGKPVWVLATELAMVRTDVLIADVQVDAAARLAAAFADGLGDRDAPAARAAVLFCQAAVAEARGAPEAADAFGAAAAAWAALPRPYDELLAVERRGRCLLAAGARPQGIEVLTDAQRRLRTLGARRDADRIAQSLRQLGVEVANAWRGGRRGYGNELSPRERQVAELVTRGLTNRQIAETLFLSPRTVDRHLGAAMRKLGVTSRTALAVATADATGSD